MTIGPPNLKQNIYNYAVDVNLKVNYESPSAESPTTISIFVKIIFNWIFDIKLQRYNKDTITSAKQNSFKISKNEYLFTVSL